MSDTSAKQDIDKTNIPTHIGIIMDGNGRWALRRGKQRTDGHLEGLKAAKKIVNAAYDLRIKYLSLYAFSTENWNRDIKEVAFLMFLIRQYLKREFAYYKKKGIKVVFTGEKNRLPKDVLKIIQKVVSDTRSFQNLTLNLAINYGGRNEIIRAVNRMLDKRENPCLQAIREEDVRNHLDHPEIPDPDLIIRTGGEHRISNFFLWEGAYSELYFCEKLWPDWKEEDLIRAVSDYQNRERRFGGTT